MRSDNKADLEQLADRIRDSKDKALRWWCFWRRAQPGVSCRRYPGGNDRRSDCNHREDRERIGSRYRLVSGGRTRAEGRTEVPQGHPR